MKKKVRSLLMKVQLRNPRRKGAHPSVIIEASDFILRINISRRIWTPCPSYLIIITLKF